MNTQEMNLMNPIDFMKALLEIPMQEQSAPYEFPERIEEFIKYHEHLEYERKAHESWPSQPKQTPKTGQYG